MESVQVVSLRMVKDRSLDVANKQICSAEDAAAVLNTYLDGADREHFVVLVLDTKHKVNAIHTVSVGSLDASLVHPREVFKVALLANASGIIVAHNHPSGNTTESPEDVAVTRRLCEAGRVLGIDVLDHIILGDNGDFLSLKGQGLM